MAHINKKTRNIIDMYPIGASLLRDGDELAYAILVLANQLLNENHVGTTEVIGAIEKAKHELYRLHVVRVEDQAKFEQGSIINEY